MCDNYNATQSSGLGFCPHTCSDTLGKAGNGNATAESPGVVGDRRIRRAVVAGDRSALPARPAAWLLRYGLLRRCCRTLLRFARSRPRFRSVGRVGRRCGVARFRLPHLPFPGQRQGLVVGPDRRSSADGGRTRAAARADLHRAERRSAARAARPAAGLTRSPDPFTARRCARRCAAGPRFQTAPRQGGPGDGPAIASVAQAHADAMRDRSLLRRAIARRPRKRGPVRACCKHSINHSINTWK